MKNELISTLSSNIGYESNRVLQKNADKFKISEPPLKSTLRLRRAFELPAAAKITIADYSRSQVFLSKIIKYIAIIIVLAFVLIFIGKFISPKLNVSLIIAILIEIGIAFILFILFVGSSILIKQTYKRLERKFDSIQIKEKQITEEFSDEVYAVIANTYETLSDFRRERERQAKNSYNAAIGLIIAGIIIVFFGVFMLFKKSITEGALASGIGAVSNILGGTILKFYKDTNNRMDRLNSDLFILNTAKVQYAMILKINDVSRRDKELGKLIVSIRNIKNAGSNPAS